MLNPYFLRLDGWSRLGLIAWFATGLASYFLFQYGRSLANAEHALSALESVVLAIAAAVAIVCFSIDRRRWQACRSLGAPT